MAPRSAGDWLRGPLALVAIGLVLSPVLGLADVVEGVRALGSDLPPDERLPLTLAVILDAMIAAFGIFGAVLFFLRRRLARLVLRLLYGVYLGVYLVTWSLGGAELPVLRVAMAVVWIAYLTWSPQVKETFTR